MKKIQKRYIPKIIVEHKGETKSFFPQEIYAMTIRKLIRDIDITDAIITVPSYYNDSQRQAIKDAGRIAGVNIIRIINEETAVCYACGLYNDKKKKNILVFNMRSNETNVTIVNIKDSIFEIKGIVRDDNLGGNSFNEELIKYCINEFKEQTRIIIQKDSKPYRRLENICEEYKKEFSRDIESTIDIEALAEGEDFNIYILRAVFEHLCRDLFDKIIPLIREVLIDSRLRKDDIDDIILTRGSTRIPKIREIIQEFFREKKLIDWIHFEEVYVYGATEIGTIIRYDKDKIIEIFFNKTHSPLGIDKSME